MGWISLDSYTSGPWSNEQNAYDEGDVPTPTTYASRYKTGSGTWTEFLELKWADGKPRLCSKLKVWARTENTANDYLDVDAYYNDQWNSVIYTSNFQAQWKQSGFGGGTYLVEKIRIRLRCSGVTSHWHRVYEAMLYEEEPSAVGYDNCIGLWRMNDNADNTTVKDDSRQDKDGMFSDTGGNPNTSQHSVAGKIKTALTFDGSDDYITVPDDAIWDVGGALTICFWFKTSTQDQGRPHFIRHDDSDYKYEIVGGSGPDPALGEILFRIKTASGISTATVSKSDDYYVDGNWHFVVGTFDRTLSSKRLRLYIDLVLEATSDAYDEDITAGDEGISIAQGGVSNFAGDLDMIVIFNTKISDSDMAWLWNGGNGREHLTGSWPLVGGSLDSGVRRLAG